LRFETLDTTRIAAIALLYYTTHSSQHLATEAARQMTVASDDSAMLQSRPTANGRLLTADSRQQPPRVWNRLLLMPV
jgi:hypothetical protein